MKDKAIKKSLKRLIGSDEFKTFDFNNMYDEDKNELASIFKQANVESFHDAVKFTAKVFGNLFGSCLLTMIGDNIINNNKINKIQEARTTIIQESKTNNLTVDDMTERFAEIENHYDKSMAYFASGVIGLDICLNALALNERINSTNNNRAKQRDKVHSIIEKYKVE